MLDLRDIPIIDNHCHPVLSHQRMDALQFRRYFSESTHPDFAQKHLPHTVYYLWLLRQLARFYDCRPIEEEIMAVRNAKEPSELLTNLFSSAGIEMLLIDTGYPPPQVCYSPEQMALYAHCQTRPMLRLELLMQQLVCTYNDFDEVVTRFSSQVAGAHEQGYCALKSIVAYRTGLNIQEWKKDDAAHAFAEARRASQQEYFRLAHKPLIDYLLHIAFQHAAEQHLPVQFHTGYGDSDVDMLLGNPLNLRTLCEKSAYHTMPIVLLHESYPYCQQGAYLAAIYPHVYFDLSYTIPFLEKLEMLTFTRQALSIAPASKLMYSSDGIHVPEMHWIAAQRGREVLGTVLQDMVDEDEIDIEQARHLARLVLHDTALNVYKI